MFVLIAYDIRSDRTRRRVAETLEAYGRRVQRSVFECDLTRAQHEELRQKLEALCDSSAMNSIRCYRLCATCTSKASLLGGGALTHTASCCVV